MFYFQFGDFCLYLVMVSKDFESIICPEVFLLLMEQKVKKVMSLYLSLLVEYIPQTQKSSGIICREPSKIRCPLFKICSRSEYSLACSAHCQEFYHFVFCFCSSLTHPDPTAPCSHIFKDKSDLCFFGGVFFYLWLDLAASSFSLFHCCC